MARFDAERHADNPLLDAPFMTWMVPARRGRPKAESPKVEVKIRPDAKTVKYLRGNGPDWQTRVNAVLGKLVATGRI
ncbi:BrnA antitoxin family protein [Methylobacterium sp. GC_Met_2]|uniref:BrnA antitoxin family protein n=1 Tax=Methylobacterium sp. GC_Met_2 TaxID=2937376 RepID=UPI00226B43C0|nr:BrnA antitoxin family protein [Methylobacterium sp. GC_Met_2]